MHFRRIAAGIVMIAAFGQAGCASISPFVPFQEVADNPLPVPASADFETVWKTTVSVVDDYFTIRSENRLSRTIKTDPRIGATLFEPWLPDSVGFQERLESTFQTIRRHAEVKVTTAPGGGYLISVVVFKELEDLVKPDRQSAGRAIFNNEFPVNRVNDLIGPVPVPIGWISRNRDPKLEQEIVRRIKDALFL
jgi:hypothetical protein